MSLQSVDQISLPSDPAAAMEAATKQYVDASAPSPDFISGFRLSYSSPTVVTVSPGAAYVQSVGVVARSIVTMNLSMSAANAFTHIYLDAGGGVGSLLTAPGAPFFGRARSAIGDTSKRYLGSVLMDSTAHLVRFVHFNDKIRYQVLPMTAPFRVLSAGTAMTSTTVDLSGVLPPTARIAHARVLNTATAGQVYIGNPDMGAASSSNYMTTARVGTETEAELLTDSSQLINYVYNASPGSGCNIDVNGYEFER